jgi:hypothetical protein
LPILQWKPKLPADLIFPSVEFDIKLSEDDYAFKLRNDLVKIYKLVNDKSSSKVDKMKFYADRNVRPSRYELGDRVWLFNETKKKGPNKKIGWKWLGPFTIIEKRNESTYVLKPDKRGRNVLANSSRLKRCYAPKFIATEQPDASAILHSTAMNEPLIETNIDLTMAPKRRGRKPGTRRVRQDDDSDANETARTIEESNIENPRDEGDESATESENDSDKSNNNDDESNNTRSESPANQSANQLNNSLLDQLSMDPQFLSLNESGGAGEQESIDQLFQPNYYYAKQVVQDANRDGRPKRDRRQPDRLNYH